MSLPGAVRHEEEISTPRTQVPKFQKESAFSQPEGGLLAKQHEPKHSAKSGVRGSGRSACSEPDARKQHPQTDKVSKMPTNWIEDASWRFETGSVVILGLNLIFLFMQMDTDLAYILYRIHFPGYDEDPRRDWHDPVFLACRWFFAVSLTLEGLLRVVVSRAKCAALKSWLVWVDIFVICSAWLELQPAGTLFVSHVVLRMVRFAKLARPIRHLLRSEKVQSLASLQMLIKGTASGFRLLCWAGLLLLVLATCSGALISYSLFDFWLDDQVYLEDRYKVAESFGTTAQSAISMLSCLLDWTEMTLVLGAKHSYWYSLPLITYWFVAGFALLQVVSAVFVNIVMANVREEAAAETKKKLDVQEDCRRSLIELFHKLDVSGNGRISLVELTGILESQELQECLFQLDVQTLDVVALFEMLDDGDLEISIDEFEAGMSQLKGPARNFDLAKLQRTVEKLSRKMDLLLSGLEPRIDDTKTCQGPGPVLSTATDTFLARQHEHKHSTKSGVRGSGRSACSEPDARKQHPQTDKVSKMPTNWIEDASWRFETGSVVILGLNLIFLFMQMDTDLAYILYRIHFPGYDEDPRRDWHDPVFLACRCFFAVSLTLEGLLRVVVSRAKCAALKSWLVWVDIFVICSAWLELQPAGTLFVSHVVLRMVRFAKLARPIRHLLRSEKVQSLASLQMLIKGTASGFRLLCWAGLLLVVLTTCSGALISSSLFDFWLDDQVYLEDRQLVAAFFGTFARSTIQMFSCLIDWTEMTLVLGEKHSYWYSIPLITYWFVAGFALLQVVSAVFVNIVMANVREEAAAETKKKLDVQEDCRRSLIELFHKLDVSGNGRISLVELTGILESQELQECLFQLDVQTLDVVALFEMLDDGDLEISIDEFEAGMSQLKGPARNFDLAKLQRTVEKLSRKMDLLLSGLEPGIDDTKTCQGPGLSRSDDTCEELD
ncbi:Kif21a [Symbiodinium sp. CCMP2592]|nr:Kif21a [Symbiodinium sp. CCMP2592]